MEDTAIGPNADMSFAPSLARAYDFRTGWSHGTSGNTSVLTSIPKDPVQSNETKRNFEESMAAGNDNGKYSRRFRRGRRRKSRAAQHAGDKRVAGVEGSPVGPGRFVSGAERPIAGAWRSFVGPERPAVGIENEPDPAEKRHREIMIALENEKKERREERFAVAEAMRKREEAWAQERKVLFQEQVEIKELLLEVLGVLDQRSG